MEADFKVSPNLVLHLDFTGQTDLFKKLALFKEIFGISSCGKCDSANIRHVVRNVDDPNKKNKTYEYFEIHCLDCHAKLGFGQKQDDNTILFPKRKDEDGKYLPDDGWVKYNKQTGTNE